MGSGEYTAGGKGGLRLVGINPILEQLRRNSSRILRIRVVRGSAAADRIREAALRAKVPVDEVPQRALAAEAGPAGQGIVAEVSEFAYLSLDEMGGDCLVAADQITDPRNLGALIRSAEGLGATGLLLPGHGTARITPIVEKAAAGATSFLPVANVGNLANALERLKKRGYWVVGLAADSDSSIQDFEFPERVVLVVGSEGAGLRSRTRALCDFMLSIPLTGSVSSLNVSVAGAIAIFCFRANRRVIDSPNSG